MGVKVRRVLVFPAGTEVGLEIYNALYQCKEVELYGAGQNYCSHAPFVYDRYIQVPSIYDDGWLDALVSICNDLLIDYIFPAYDDVIVALAKERYRIPCVVIAPELDACLITRSKNKTYNRLKDILRVPILYSITEDITYPVIVKPDTGQGAQGVCLASDGEQVARALDAISNGLICEYLPGDEYTIDCFSDRENGLLFCGARVRQRMRNGIAVNTRTVALPEINGLAKKISDNLNLYGPWFFQLKRASDGELVLLEVAPRIAGSMSAHRVQGVNFPLLAIFESERLPIRMLVNPIEVELDRALSNRYKVSLSFGVAYVDLDDTLLLRGKVNASVIGFVFSCINNGVKVKLITRHVSDLDATLRRHRLVNLFDEVIHIGLEEKKSKFIVESDAIFLDDSFSERWDVHTENAVKTFDCSMIDVLLSSFCQEFRGGYE